MPNANAKDLPINSNGERIHVQPYGRDAQHQVSTVEDNTSPLVTSNNNPTIVTATVDPADPHAVILHPVSQGTGIVFVDTNPPSDDKLQIAVNVTAPLPPNSRVAFVSADDPT